jgi:hypothetical protein
VIWKRGRGRLRLQRRQKGRRIRYLAAVLVLAFSTPPLLAQEKASQQPMRGINADIAEMMHAAPQTPAPPGKRSITLSDAVSIFLQQNLQLVAGRFDKRWRMRKVDCRLV